MSLQYLNRQLNKKGGQDWWAHKNHWQQSHCKYILPLHCWQLLQQPGSLDLLSYVLPRRCGYSLLFEKLNRIFISYLDSHSVSKTKLWCSFLSMESYFGTKNPAILTLTTTHHQYHMATSAPLLLDLPGTSPGELQLVLCIAAFEMISETWPCILRPTVNCFMKYWILYAFLDSNLQFKTKFLVDVQPSVVYLLF